MSIEYFCCYHSYKTTLRRLSDEEVGRLVRALIDYSETGIEPELPGHEMVAFDFISADIDRAKQAYEEKCRKNRENGVKRCEANGTERVRTVPNATDRYRSLPNATDRYRTGANGSERTQSKSKDKSKDKGKDKGKSKDNSPNGECTRAGRFTPPTLAEVQSYVAERHSPVDPQGFIDFYASKGWMVGKTPMKDWKAACRNAEKWERWEKTAQKQGKSDTQPDANRIRENDAWLEKFLEEQNAETGN